MRADLVSTARVIAFSAAIATLASCGGGGGGGPTAPVATVSLNAANAQNVAGDVLLASVQTAGKTGTFVPLDAQGGALRKTHVLTQFLRDQIGRLGELRRPASAIHPNDVVVQSCTNMQGDITIVSDANSITETFNACLIAPGEVINGVITISGFSSTPSSFSASVSVNLTFSVTGFPAETFTGNFTISQTGLDTNLVTITISGSNLTLQTGTHTENLGSFTFSTTIDITTSATTDSVSFVYSSSEIGGTVTVTTLTPFQTTPGREFPHAGAIQITGVGSAIRVTVNGDETGATPQVTIQLDANGDGVFETTLNRNWSDLTA